MIVEQGSAPFFARRRRKKGIGSCVVALCLLAVSSGRAFATDFTVTTTTDSNGVCGGSCSLREAIAAANASAGADRVILGTGKNYQLSLGALGVTDALTIDGHGSTIDGQGLSRVLDIQGGFAVTINDLTITGGIASGFLSFGGGLNIAGGGSNVILNNCTVTANSTAVESGARDNGGGIAVAGSYSAAGGVATLAALTLNNSTVSGNTGLNGGGILCVLCALTVT